jgi:ribonuclease P protein component
MPLTFPKAEKLCGKREIAALVTHGRRGGSGCLRYCYLVAPLAPISPVVPDSLVSPDPSTSPAAEPLSDQVRILISVPKKLFKRAVKRNLLKRRIREAFRLQKELLLTPDPSGQANDLSTPGTDTPATAHTARRYDILFTYSAPDVRSYEEIRAAVAAILTDIRTLSH